MTDPSPLCPGCGYPIFGLRDMRCPECGRVLDVRDFNLGAGDSEGRMRKLRRDGQIGITVGVFALMIPTALALLLVGTLVYYGYNPGCFTLVVIVFVVWVWRVLKWIGNEALPARKRRP